MYIYYKNKLLIEIGCGTGDFAISLAKSGAQKVVGVDIDRNSSFLHKEKQLEKT